MAEEVEKKYTKKKVEAPKRAVYKWAREMKLDVDVIKYWENDMVTEDEFLILAKKVYRRI
jgi:hypothetical protein